MDLTDICFELLWNHIDEEREKYGNKYDENYFHIRVTPDRKKGPYAWIIRFTYVPTDFYREFLFYCPSNMEIREKAYIEHVKYIINKEMDVFFIQIKPRERWEDAKS